MCVLFMYVRVCMYMVKGFCLTNHQVKGGTHPPTCMLSRSMSIMERRSCHDTPPSAAKARRAGGGGASSLLLLLLLPRPAPADTYCRMGGQRLMPVGCVHEWGRRSEGGTAVDAHDTHAKRLQQRTTPCSSTGTGASSFSTRVRASSSPPPSPCFLDARGKYPARFSSLRWANFRQKPPSQSVGFLS